MALFSKVLNPPPESSSRLDAKVALLMRTEGHSREAVTEAIRRYGPEWRGEEKRDWRRYAGRTAGYAFGMAGDMELAKSGDVLQAQWRDTEGIIEGIVETQPETTRIAPRMRIR
jgi:hypothetical protein